MQADINIVKMESKKCFQQDSAHFKESHYSVRYRAHEWQSIVSAVHKDGRVYTVPPEAKQNYIFTSTFIKMSAWMQMDVPTEPVSSRVLVEVLKSLTVTTAGVIMEVWR